MTDFKKKLKKIAVRISIPLFFTVSFAIITNLSAAFVVFGIRFLFHTGIIPPKHAKEISAVFVLLSCLITGAVITLFISCMMMKTINKYINVIDSAAHGDYSARLNLKTSQKMFRRLDKSINNMMTELSRVEMISSDFVNNFSHEFKTPIVSIRGFANILKNNDLTQDEKDEYLDIIINESERLAELSTNILNLSKIENQTILTDIENVNISEQIRIAISIIDSKWNAKNIEFSLLSDEDIYVSGNTKLLKQIWINLLDNAAKFSPKNGKVTVLCNEDDEKISAVFTNECDFISEETLEHIFDKFYQGDTSHAVKGNGLGLAIAKKITELHNGTISVSQNSCSVSFKVIIEKKR